MRLQTKLIPRLIAKGFMTYRERLVLLQYQDARVSNFVGKQW